MAQTDNAPNKPVHLMFLSGAIVLFYVLQWSIIWIYGKFVGYPNEFRVTLLSGAIAVATAIVLYRNERIYKLADDVAVELSKVTWPTAKEVKAATLVVVIVTLIAAVILGAMDLVWSRVTDMIFVG